MKKYKELKVYRIADPEYDGCQSSYDTVYVCRGIACDHLKNSWNRGCSIKEERILYTGECPTEEDILCRAFNAEKEGVTTILAYHRISGWHDGPLEQCENRRGSRPREAWHLNKAAANENARSFCMIFVFAAAYAALGILFAPATVIIEDYYRSKYLRNSLDLLDSFAIGLLSLAGAWIILIPYNVHLIAKRRKINR